MKIDLSDPRVGDALSHVKIAHCPKNAKELEEVFEKVYHCKIVSTDAPLHTQGYIEISEEKYQTWFLINFGGRTDEQLI